MRGQWPISIYDAFFAREISATDAPRILSFPGNVGCTFRLDVPTFFILDPTNSKQQFNFTVQVKDVLHLELVPWTRLESRLFLLGFLEALKG